MLIKAATNLASLNVDGCKQTIKTNLGSSRATPIRTTLDKHKTTYKTTKKIVKGNGVAAVAAAIPVYQDGRKPKRAWCILLDSGSDGDLIFGKSADVKSTNPQKKTHSLVWGTSSRDSKTTDIGSVKLKFPDFSRNKRFSVNPDTVRLKKKTHQILLLT